MYEDLTVAQLRKAALELGDAKAIAVIAELYNDVFHKDDSSYPNGLAATILPEVKARKEEDEPKRVDDPSDDEKRSEELRYWLDRMHGCGDRFE